MHHVGVSVHKSEASPHLCIFMHPAASTVASLAHLETL